MSDDILVLRGVTAKREEREILRGIDWRIPRGTTQVLVGSNGAGKSTLAALLAGDEELTVRGEVSFDGEDLLLLRATQRARRGLFVSWQNPPELPGVSVGAFLRLSVEAVTGEKIRPWDFRGRLQEALERLELDEAWSDREVNVGFSGGERKKLEMLQLLLLRPRLAVLDELDSGLDADAVRVIGDNLRSLQADGVTLIVISHNFALTTALSVDGVAVMQAGKLGAQGGKKLLEDIKKHGYTNFIKN